MFSEEDLLPISALQHLLFCERQCALIHIERVWLENRLTMEGRFLHDRAHGTRAGPRGGGLDESRLADDGRRIRVARSLPLRSLRLGLFGIADVVEFHPPEGGGVDVPMPVEYKRGRPKRDDCDLVQLAAQALCLEEMLDSEVSKAAFYYGRTRRRTEVRIDDALRQTTERAAVRLHTLVAAGITPLAKRQPKCKHCSLLNVCMPDALRSVSAGSRYVSRQISRVFEPSKKIEEEPS